MAVADCLTAAGVHDGRLTVRCAGDSTPIARNNDDDRRARNLMRLRMSMKPAGAAYQSN